MKSGRKRVHSARFWLISALAVLLLIGVGVGTLRIWYITNLRPVSSSAAVQYFTVETGTGVHQIAAKLKKAELIRSSKAFEFYVRGNELYSGLQRGTYILTPSMSVQEIVNRLVKGEVAKNLLTILPGKRLDQIQQAFSKAGYSQEEINKAFNPATYSGHQVLTNLPAGASLEGFLYPDSFQKLSDTPAETIVRESLDEMQAYLTPNIVSGFSAQGLNVFQGVTLASIVYQETDDPAYQSTVAQVFLKRLRQGTRLQSNVTANYAADLANRPRDISIDSPYNTYLYNGLTPGPIGNFTKSALSAVAEPANSDYLFFVAGDDGKVYFSHNADEHQALIKQYCKKKCAQ